jgi:hypothetical protein
MLASVVIALGAASFLGYVSGTQDSQVWGALVGMALHTSLGFMILGFCIFMMSWQNMARAPVWIPIPVFIMLIATTLSIWQATKDEDKQQLKGIVGAEAQSISQITQKYLVDLYKALDG